MKALKCIILLAFMSVSFFACKKDNAEKKFEFHGSWEGKLGDQVPTGFFGLKLAANGKLERYNATGEVTATGAWKIEGNVFSGDYKFPDDDIKVTLNGTVNLSDKKITGTWLNSYGVDGNWYATKTNK